RDTAAADITQPDLLVANATATDESAVGENDGTAAANPSGGTTPYNFNWSNGQMSASITNLAPGNYTVTVSDANNCTAMQSVTVLPGTPAGGCGTFAGTMNLSPLALCEQDTAFAIHNGNEILESGDLLEFILHDRSDTILGNIFGQKNSPAFSFLPVLERGKTYYISAVAGRDDGTGFVDLNDPCLSISQGTPVIFNRQPLPAYALQAPDVVCGNEPFLLEADDLFPNPSITYHWLLANGAIFQTSAPEFTLLPTSGDFTGDYFVARDSGACLSKFSPPVFVEIISLPSGEIMTGQDTILCNQNTFELSAQQPSSGQGRWHSVTFSTIQNPTQPNTTVTNLQPGENIFVWSVSVGACRDALADTLRVFVEQPPQLRDDEYTLQRASDIIAMNVLLNDRIGGISDTTVTLLGAPEFGDLEYLENKKSFRYSLSEERRGRVQFQYVVCNSDAICGEACDTATVVINVLALPEMPEGLTLNGDGRNDVLTIRGIRGFERVEVLIVNRWGDVVFEEKDYDNDRPWRGTLGYEGSELPQGAYYYIVKAFENGSLVGDPLTGAVHIFR
ncbi:MAG TPA: gliding motility-associated C-terminal domain-containing protein, partial [Saprospiraceae bacterium]|nr:gliding motility-associated C-terminal domain-containing protein [Saprospiraceae bacterium]